MNDNLKILLYQRLDTQKSHIHPKPNMLKAFSPIFTTKYIFKWLIFHCSKKNPLLANAQSLGARGAFDAAEKH